ncbi:Fic family protein [Candidatus Gracilibacteria bacterium]|nr:Fic family protein [Candidatus Gracilibacteria bacterium]
MSQIFHSGTYRNQYKYKSFLPSSVNVSFAWNDPKINILLEKANLELGKLESFSHFIPDIDFFISMHVGKEAVKSSKIEGTKTEFDDLFLDDIDIETIEARDDVEEVRNYIEALHVGIKELNYLPLSFRLFSKIHKILLRGVRGEHKNPGEIRKSQNWIGGSNLENAFFIPPHHDDLSECIKDFELFLHNDDIQIPELIKVALAHYQFETIHPYLDGNGRIGRLIIILYLIEKKILTKPVLYISDFFERNKGAYYDALTVARSSNDIEHFIKFFLTGIIETCQSSISTFEQILILKKDIEAQILLLGSRAEKAQKVFHHLFGDPIVTSHDIIKLLDVTPATANTFIKIFVDMGVLKEVTGFKRHKLFAFENYLRLFR